MPDPREGGRKHLPSEKIDLVRRLLGLHLPVGPLGLGPGANADLVTHDREGEPEDGQRNGDPQESVVVLPVHQGLTQPLHSLLVRHSGQEFEQVAESEGSHGEDEAVEHQPPAGEPADLVFVSRDLHPPVGEDEAVDPQAECQVRDEHDPEQHDLPADLGACPVVEVGERCDEPVPPRRFGRPVRHVEVAEQPDHDRGRE